MVYITRNDVLENVRPGEDSDQIAHIGTSSRFAR